MKIEIVLAILSFSMLHAGIYAPKVGDAVVNGDDKYYKIKDEKSGTEIIYTKKHLNFAKHTIKREYSLHKKYQSLYDWKLDSTLYVGLISDKNQIANGYSTQWPINKQINYIGGTELIDNFASISWLDTLLYHESSHNYQLNIKDNFYSQWIYKLFGNGIFLVPLPLSIPNTTENPFMLEGNAVLHEAIHGNGGRLYNGSYKAQTILQAKAGKIKAAEVYNMKLAFPYGDIAYIQGGFYNLYMAQKYGLKNLNSYFKYHSQDFLWPQFTNNNMKSATGIDFEDSLDMFTKYYSKLANHFVSLKGKHFFSSAFYTPLSSSQENIYFLIQNISKSPILVNINKKTKKINKYNNNWLSGKVIQKNDKYFIQASHRISSVQIAQGIFDNNANIEESSISKMIQGYLKDGRDVYFDVSSSYSQPQLYVGKKFYAQVNSSVYIDNDDNLYYFKQKGKKRVLYKNRTPLYSYSGFYGIISDVDTKGNIFFIANSKLGSTLYFYKQGEVFRASDADNIKGAKLLNDKELLLCGVSDKDYYYVINKIKKINNKPYNTKYFFENKDYYITQPNVKVDLSDLNETYNSLLDMHYSGSDIFLSYSSTDNFIGLANIKYSDPLSQNSLAFYAQKTAYNTSFIGLEYANKNYLIDFNINGYKIISSALNNTNSYGWMFNTTLPLYRAGYINTTASMKYYQDYQTLTRTPLSFIASFDRTIQNTASLFPSTLNAINIFGVKDRNYLLAGWEYKFIQDLNNLFYLGGLVKYVTTSATSKISNKGIKLSSFVSSYDPSSIDIANISYEGYAKSVKYYEINFNKVFNFSKYFFTFPVSFRQQVLYLKYRYYDLEAFSKKHYKVNQITTGLKLYNIYFNSQVIPMSLEYIHDDAIDFIKNNNTFTIKFGFEF